VPASISKPAVSLRISLRGRLRPVVGAFFAAAGGSARLLTLARSQALWPMASFLGRVHPDERDGRTISGASAGVYVKSGETGVVVNSGSINSFDQTGIDFASGGTVQNDASGTIFVRKRCIHRWFRWNCNELRRYRKYTVQRGPLGAGGIVTNYGDATLPAAAMRSDSDRVGQCHKCRDDHRLSGLRGSSPRRSRSERRGRIDFRFSIRVFVNIGPGTIVNAAPDWINL